jgi:hypothetical protein
MSTFKSKRVQIKDSISAMKRVKRTAKKRSSKTGSFSSELGKLISVFGQLADQAYQSYSPIVEDIVNSKSLNSKVWSFCTPPCAMWA